MRGVMGRESAIALLTPLPTSAMPAAGVAIAPNYQRGYWALTAWNFIG
ncbi:hypothetical protein [Nostoc sp.]